MAFMTILFIFFSQLLRQVPWRRRFSHSSLDGVPWGLQRTGRHRCTRLCAWGSHQVHWHPRKSHHWKAPSSTFHHQLCQDTSPGLATIFFCLISLKKSFRGLIGNCRDTISTPGVRCSELGAEVHTVKTSHKTKLFRRKLVCKKLS